MGLGTDIFMRSGKFKMKMLVRIGNGASGQECSAEKGCFAAIFFQNGKIYVMRKILIRLQAETFEDSAYLAPVADKERCFTCGGCGRDIVKAGAEHFTEQFRKAGGKIAVGGDYANFGRGKAGTEKQNAIAFCQRTAFLFLPESAYFVFGIGGE